jgi:hypothetical protein
MAMSEEELVGPSSSAVKPIVKQVERDFTGLRP